MKLLVRPCFHRPCVRFSKSSFTNRHNFNNAIHETLSLQTYNTVIVANKSRVIFNSKFSTWGITRQYEEDEEEEEEQGPVWQVIEKFDEDTKQEKPSNPDPTLQQPRQQNMVAVHNNSKEEDTSVNKEISHTIITPTQNIVTTEDNGHFKKQIKWNQQLNSLIRLGKIPQAMTMIDHALQSNEFPLNLVNFNSIAKCYSKLSQVEKIQKLMKEMGQRGIQPNAITFNILIDTCGKRKDLQQMSNVFEKMLKEGVQPTISTFTSMMHSFFKCGMAREALMLFNQMPDYGLQPNQECCMLALRIVAKNKDFEKAEAIVHLFEANNWKLDSSGLFYMIEAYAEIGNIEKCIYYFEKRNELLQFTDLGLWTKHLQILAEKGTMEQFWKYYCRARSELPRCDSVFYTAVLGALLKREQLPMFWKVAEHLNADTQIGPGQTTWWSVALMDVYMRGCIKSQKFEEVPTILKRMQQFNLKPDLDLLSGMASTGCESLQGENFNNFVHLYARVAGAYVRYKEYEERNK